MKQKIKAFLLSAYGPMTAVVAMYSVKAPVKIWVGHVAGLTAIVADGYHNGSDFTQGLLAMWFIRIIAAAATREFPLGKKNLASLFKVFVGVCLGYLAITTGFQSLQTLWDVCINHGSFPVRFSQEYAPIALIVAIVSMALSIPVSEYQIRTGERLNNGILIADGKETRSDAILEVVIVAGILGQMIGGWAWIEYPLTLVVCVFMIQTARELIADGLDALLQRSIGEEHENAIQEIVKDMYGVQGVDQIITFKIGPMVILIMKVLSRHGAEVTDIMKKAMAMPLARYLGKQGFEDGKFFIRFAQPDPDAHRRAVAIERTNGINRVARRVGEATHIAICDIEHDRVVRDPVEDVHRLNPAQIAEFLAQKNVREIVLSESPMDSMRKKFREFGIEIVCGHSTDLSVYEL